MKTNHRLIALLSGLSLVALLAGCGAPKDSTAMRNDASADDAAQTSQVEQEAQSKDTAKQAPKVEWETQVFKDDKLSYEIPSDWKKNDKNSNEETHITLFHDKNTKTNKPSNVVVVILDFENEQDLDYADPAIQKEFHEFLISPSGLPQEEAKTGEFAAEQIGETWVYSLAFDRVVEDGQTVHQTVYYPMGFDYLFEICATDFHDDCPLDVNEVAKHICATIEIA